jgi:hypothetical protein
MRLALVSPDDIVIPPRTTDVWPTLMPFVAAQVWGFER